MSLENSTCDRCNTKSNVLTGSYFNIQMICISCDDKETSHPKYSEAKRIEGEQVSKGNYNYKGMGLPKDLRK